MRYFFFIFVILFLAWLLGLVWFVHQIKQPNPVNHPSVSAIVVLTGSGERIPEALELVEQTKTNYFFISGVDSTVRLSEIRHFFMQSQVDWLQNDALVLDKKAYDTHTNAIEVAKWVNEHNIRDFVLVTSNYHMPRSLLEIRKLLPHTTIYSHHTHPENVLLDDWWQHKGTRNLLLEEYHKYLAVWLGIDNTARKLILWMKDKS